MRPIADLTHSAYDTLEFIKEHYPEMVQMYETIMAHLKVPEAAPVEVEPSTPASDTHVAYTITDVFDSIAIDPDIIHNVLGYTDSEIPLMAKRAGLKYLGLYNAPARLFEWTSQEVDPDTGNDYEANHSYSYEARQLPMFAVIKSNPKDDPSEYITKIPLNHKRCTVTFKQGYYDCDIPFIIGEGAGDTYNRTFRKGILWVCGYSHEYKPVDNTYDMTRKYESWDSDVGEYVTVNDGTSYGSIGEYGCKEAYLANNPISVTTLIGVNDDIYLPEVL